jgi:hypothetical protein
MLKLDACATPGVSVEAANAANIVIARISVSMAGVEGSAGM